jgi:xylose isomerase
MSGFAPAGADGAGGGIAEPKEWFAGIPTIEYEGPSSKNPLAFKHYNPNEVVLGKKMSEWCRFSVCYWHTFRGSGADPFGFPTLPRCVRMRVCAWVGASRSRASVVACVRAGVSPYNCRCRCCCL